MLMEAFAGMEHKYSYQIVGHSGESHNIPFVTGNTVPKNRKDRLEVIRSM